jgi:protein-tyrosine phosphatase
MKRVLFVCTGNFYRSRFAEAVFNFTAEKRGMVWRAFSRGLAIHIAPEGPLSEDAIRGLAERGICQDHTAPCKAPATEADFAGASVIVAMHELEHRPLLHEKFPAWEDRTRYWHVPDVHDMDPGAAMRLMDDNVRALADELAVS